MGRPIANMAGMVFDRLKVLEPTDMRSGSSVIWKCQCSCDNITYVSQNCLKSRTTKSCGCLRSDVKSADLRGKSFLKLTALDPTDERDGPYVVWRTRCICNNIVLASSYDLVHKRIYSCGCVRRKPTGRPRRNPNVSEK